jgi:hypothetical protein
MHYRLPKEKGKTKTERERGEKGQLTVRQGEEGGKKTEEKECKIQTVIELLVFAIALGFFSARVRVRSELSFFAEAIPRLAFFFLRSLERSYFVCVCSVERGGWIGGVSVSRGRQAEKQTPPPPRALWFFLLL